MYFLGLNNCQVKFLNNLGKTKVPMFSQISAIILHPVWSYFFVSKSQLNWGIFGTGVAGVITNFTNFSFNLIYTYMIDEIKDGVFMPDGRSFQQIGEYFRLGVPSAFMFALDVWAGSIVRFASGYLGVDVQSAQIILNNIMVLLYMIGSGLDSAACALVGQSLGAGDVLLANKFYQNFKWVSAAIIFLVMISFYYSCETIVGMYTTIPGVRQEALSAVGLIVMNIFPDLFKGMLKGVIKALGIQYKAVYVHIFCHWGVFVGLTYLFAFHYNLGIAGLWYAKICLEWSIVSFYTFIIYNSDWEQIAKDAQERSKRN